MRPILIAGLSLGLLFAAGSANASGSGPSIAGLTAGMTVEDVQSKLGADFTQADTTNIQRGQIANFAKAGEDFNVLAMGNKTVYIEHQQFFAPGGEISADELTKALVSKYGPPSISNDQDHSQVWIMVDGKTLVGDALTDQLHNCAAYETQGPFFRASETNNFALNMPRVPVQPQFASCGTVITAKPSLMDENPGLVTHLTVTLFDVKLAQDWYNNAQTAYNKRLKDAVDAARKNKPNL